MQEINKEILIFLNSLIQYNFIEQIALYSSDIPIFFLPIFLVSAWLYFTYKKADFEKKKNLLFLFYGTIIAIFFNLIVQQIITVERPEKALEGIGKLILNHIPDASFPSDHASVSVSFLVGLFFAKYKKIGYSFLLFVIIMNLSRIILGIHWPSDILGGIIVGIISATISFKILKKNKSINKINNFIIKVMGYLKL